MTELRARLQELEETLEAIRSGGIDALIVSGVDGDQVFTLQGAEHPYRVLVESMNEGAATLTATGDLLYANRCLAEMVGIGLEQLIGSPLRERIRNCDVADFDACLAHARIEPQKLRCDLETAKGLLSVYLSLSPLRQHDFNGICMIATDLTQQKLREAELAQEVGQRKRAEEALLQEEQSLRELSGRLLRLQDEERRRLARDLHDSTGQKLVALTLEMGMLETQLAAVSPAVAKTLEECRQLADEVTTDIRTLSYVLHPPLLDEAGLSSAAQWFVDGFVRRSKIHVDLNLPPNLGRMPQDLELTLFRILQESLTNVHRHSGSTTADVRISIADGQVTLEVKDAGKSPISVSLGQKSVELLGVGVRGMQERVRQLGGRLELRSGADGTVMRATLPYTSLQ
ncbi:MAG TPA: histidine kinase [Terriglobales bacterium]|nr:histidine kinase [Terriglobales bacterium]